MYICSVRGSVCTCEQWIREMCICTANTITSAKIKQKNILYFTTKTVTCDKARDHEEYLLYHHSFSSIRVYYNIILYVLHAVNCREIT